MSSTVLFPDDRSPRPSRFDAPAPAGHFQPLRSRVFLIGLALILTAAALLRLPMLDAASQTYRTTEAFNMEETESIRLSTGMIHERSLNPHAFLYPSLHYDLSLLAELPLAAAARLTWPNAVVAVRALSLLLGLGTVALAGLLAARLGGPASGLLASTLLAFDRTLMTSSTLAKPDSLHEFLVVGGFLALATFADRPRLRNAMAAAAIFGLAASTKWFGGAGVIGVALVPVLAIPAGTRHGLARGTAVLRAALRERLTPVELLLPPLTFVAAFLLATPYAFLSPREFVFGFGVSFTAQGLHQIDASWIRPLEYLVRSLGPLGAGLAAGGLVWALVRLARWDGSPRENTRLLVTGWALAYGGLLLFVFVRLPSYLDLWVPFLAVIAGSAWVGDQGILRAPAARIALIAIALAAGLWSNGGFSAARHAAVERDTRTVAAQWLSEHASPDDAVLADLGALVPDAITHVEFNAWGSPPRVLYDETSTWGTSRVWPEWHGGHRRLMFVNAKWKPPTELLAQSPRWVVTTSLWQASRSNPGGASETAAPEFDARLANGEAGYVGRARFVPRYHEGNPWQALREARDPSSSRWFAGPTITIYERASAAGAK